MLNIKEEIQIVLPNFAGTTLSLVPRSTFGFDFFGAIFSTN
jgi:hypothetical protein